ncbi:LGFP repeat-containing protein [Corynebacterium mayonis]|uniref:LGFP repeat-containing protein n=1 Tax=Corynebacterium mayonis TaxID=3062461 RepID=UPI0031409E7B
MNFTQKAAAVASALVLTGGLVACSQEDEDKNASATATSTVEQTATEGSTAAETSSESVTSVTTSTKTEAAEGETVEVATADGQTTLVPQGVKGAMDEYGADWGMPASIEQTDNGWIVSYDDEHYVAWNESTGGAPTWGQISKEWLGNLRSDNTLGFPTAPEQALAEGNGWTQEFEHGTITWAEGEDGTFGPTVEVM